MATIAIVGVDGAGKTTVAIRLEHDAPRRIKYSIERGRVRRTRSATWLAVRIRFAFPDRSNPLLDEYEQRHGDALRSAFSGKAAYRVSHSYPVVFEELFEHMRHQCRPGADRDERTPMGGNRWQP